jgi:PKD repeat protein
MHVLKKILPLFALIGLIVWAGCNKDDDDNNAPVAAFSYETTDMPGEIQFTNQSQNAQIYDWDFGNGNRSTMINPAHTYDENGDFIVTLKATGQGQTVSVSDTVTVNNIP